LLRQRENGVEYSLIAERLGRSTNSVKCQQQVLSCSKPSVARRGWTVEEEQLLLKMSKEGLTQTAMADRLGRTKLMVKGKLLGLRNPNYGKREGKVNKGRHGYRTLARQALNLLPNKTGSVRDVYDMVPKLPAFSTLPQHTGSGHHVPVWHVSLRKALSRYPEFVSSQRNAKGNSLYTYNAELGPDKGRKRKAVVVESEEPPSAKRVALDDAKTFMASPSVHPRVPPATTEVELGATVRLPPPLPAPTFPVLK
jgi:hypothetical protein